MRIKTLLLVLVTSAIAIPASPVGAQGLGDVFVTPLVSWFTGDSAVGEGPSAPAGPKLYAEETCCGDGCCGCCSDCCRQYDVWGSVEFLMWWGKGTPLPPLVSTSLPGTLQGDAGVLGLSSTSILFGNEIAGNKLQGGGRVTAGIWMDPDHNVAVGGRFFGTGGDTTRFAQSSTGAPILAIPFFNAQLNQQDSFIVAFPGFSQGGVTARLTTNNIIGAEAFTEIMMSRDCRRRIDLIAGYQFFRLDDWLQIDSNSTLTQAGNPLAGLRVDLSDRFSTRNQFHGGEFGLRGRLARGQWSLNLLGQVAIGNMNQQVSIAGTTTTTAVGGAPSTSQGGLLTQPSNIGTVERNRFAYIPQLIGNLNYHVNPNLSFHVGYNILWISDVALSGDQIDTTVNLNQPNGPARPAFAFNDREYWLQGINWGMNWDF
jgi:Putative beta barrel porin-7 (BBP7)